MDAKVLRAAVSAAIRVSVSTTLIGCGGSVTTDAGGAAGATTSGVSAAGSGKSGGDTTTPAYPSPVAMPAAGGTGGAPAATASAGTQTVMHAGGMASAGTASTSEGGNGEAGEPSMASGGAGPSFCACAALLADVKAGEALSSDAQVCCQVVIDDYPPVSAADQACVNDFQWFVIPAHQQCCTTLDAWLQPACTPWGPPVPAEAPLAALLDWELAA